MGFAYIFDFDGVLVNTMEAHYMCYKKALEEYGVPIDKKQFYFQAGMTGREQIRYFCHRADKDLDVEAIYKRKNEIAKTLNNHVSPIVNNIQLLKLLKKECIPVAIATGSSRPSILPIMEKFDIEVDAIVTSEDVKRGKPHPDLFLCAADKLKVAPHNCIVIEDSDVGIEAARAAGMKSLRFYEYRKDIEPQDSR